MNLNSLPAYRRLSKRKIPPIGIGTLFAIWLGLTVYYYSDEPHSEDVTTTLLREADIELSLAESLENKPSFVHSLLWCSDEKTTLKRLAGRFEKLEEEGKLESYAHTHLKTIQLLQEGKADELEVEGWFSEYEEQGLWTWQYLALKKRGDLENLPDIAYSADWLSRRTLTLAFLGELPCWVLSLVGSVILWKYRAKLRNPPNALTPVPFWSCSFALGICLLTCVVGDISAFLMYSSPLPWDSFPFATLILSDTLWRASSVLFASYFLLAKWKDGPRLLGLLKKPNYHLILGAIPIVFICNFIIYSGWEMIGWGESDGTLDFYEDGWLGLLYIMFSSAIMAPLVEEIVFRGFLFQGLIHRLGFGRAALLSSLIFALIHNYDVPGSLSVGFFGFLCCWLYKVTGSLWTGILFHSLYNILITLSVWPLFHGLFSL